MHPNKRKSAASGDSCKAMTITASLTIPYNEYFSVPPVSPQIMRWRHIINYENPAYTLGLFLTITEINLFVLNYVLSCGITSLSSCFLSCFLFPVHISWLLLHSKISLPLPFPPQKSCLYLLPRYCLFRFLLHQ